MDLHIRHLRGLSRRHYHRLLAHRQSAFVIGPEHFQPKHALDLIGGGSQFGAEIAAI
jgi:hypothetical protein